MPEHVPEPDGLQYWNTTALMLGAAEAIVSIT